MKKRRAKHNSMTCGQYVREHLIWGVLALFLYRQLLFRTCRGRATPSPSWCFGRWFWFLYWSAACAPAAASETRSTWRQI